MMEAARLTANNSSIRANGLLGDYDKLSTTRLFMTERFGIDLDAHEGELVFVGDSPNDAPMLAYFPQSMGVANVKEFLDFLPARPAYVSPSRCGGHCGIGGRIAWRAIKK